MHKGACLCGAVNFEVADDLSPVEACHCEQCRKWTSHFLASTEVKRSDLTVTGSDSLSWFHSSEKVRRGFCSVCGASLFFDPIDQEKHDWVGVSMGAIDTPTQTKMALHIFVAEKGDYYEIDDGLPQNPY
ncbi:MAG: GFA family protein [Xanthomonadales bacterium]|nr:GFA family protein [Gammaproteobacteria bacterium]MBT8053110.1 GFA family protein [Gammaproteobacteria bacterium]NND56238.1 GFA family protein [Xanthomonadales bacterium]NNK52313.1 GFA family protein [Xanthomonadales bacterium]